MDILLMILAVIAIFLIGVIIYSQLPVRRQVYTGNIRWYITSMVGDHKEVSPFYLTEKEARVDFDVHKETECDMHLYKAWVTFNNGEEEILDDEVIDSYWDEDMV